MKKKIRQQLDKCKRRIERRLDRSNLGEPCQPAFTGGNVEYQMAQRARGLSYGGIAAIHALAGQLGLVGAIDKELHLLKYHLPYHESDHVLNLAYNALCGGTCLQDLELRRNDEVFLDALGAERIPDPTTAGDFCRRFEEKDIRVLQQAFHTVRKNVWAQQPQDFFEQAVVDCDGFLVPTTGQCKQGIGLAYDGTWGYHPLVVSLANTGEVLSIVNRCGNRPSHEGADVEIDHALEVCFAGGFQKVLLRGDTDFSQTQHLDRWNQDERVRFIFGYDAAANLKEIADQIAPRHWKPLGRPPRYEVATEPRERPENVKEKIVTRRKYNNVVLESEQVCEFNYRPTACRETYRMVVLRKNLLLKKGEEVVERQMRYFFYLTNDWMPEPEEIVCCANGRCNQENLLSQLHSGVRALRAPVDNLLSNWAYAVMTALAWDLKAWWALSLPEEPGRWAQRHRREKYWVLRLEFKTFVNAFVAIAAQLVRGGRKRVLRLLSYNVHLPIFFRLVTRLNC